MGRLEQKSVLIIDLVKKRSSYLRSRKPVITTPPASGNLYIIFQMRKHMYQVSLFINTWSKTPTTITFEDFSQWYATDIGKCLRKATAAVWQKTANTTRKPSKTAWHVSSPQAYARMDTQKQPYLPVTRTLHRHRPYG